MQELGLVEVINHNQEVAKWVRSWSVMKLIPVEEIDNVVSASLAFYNKSCHVIIIIFLGKPIPMYMIMFMLSLRIFIKPTFAILSIN